MASEENDKPDIQNNIAETAAVGNEEGTNSSSEHSGWLLKRTKLSHKWKKKWFVLKNTELHYGDQEGELGRVELGMHIWRYQYDFKGAVPVQTYDAEPIFWGAVTYLYILGRGLMSQCAAMHAEPIRTTPKKIPLQGAEIAEATVDNKKHAFRVRPSNSKRVFYLQAPDEAAQHGWMQAICFAKATGHGDKSEACTLQ